MNIYVCTEHEGHLSYLQRLEPPRGSRCHPVRVRLIIFLGEKSELEREVTHRCVEVCPVGYSRSTWDRLGEAGVKPEVSIRASRNAELGLTFRQLHL